MLLRSHDVFHQRGSVTTENQGHSLSYRTPVNGAPTNPVQIDTTQAATDHHRLRCHRPKRPHRNEHPYRHHPASERQPGLKHARQRQGGADHHRRNLDLLIPSSSQNDLNRSGDNSA